MESHRRFDYKSDLDFPSLSSNVASFKRNTSPQEKMSQLQNGNRESRDNSRSMSRGRGKKQNWKAVHVEFPNSNGQRYQQRGASRPRFPNNHAIPKPADEPYEFSYRGYRSGSRSRIRRARGGAAPHNFGRPQSVESTTPLLSNSPTSELSPTIMAIPYTPNYAAYVQPHVTAPMDIEEAIRHQIEYYFSEENLIKDNYMRMNMTSEGFLPIELISNFNKIKQFNVDSKTIIRAIEASDKLDVIDGKIVRPVIDPLRWPLNRPLPPPVSNMMKNFVQPYSFVSPTDSFNGIIFQEVVSEHDTRNLSYLPGAVELGSINDMVFQKVEDNIDHLSTSIGSITFEEKTVFNFPQCYPTEIQDQQNSLDKTKEAIYIYNYPIDSQDEIIQEKPQTVNYQKDSQQDEAPKVKIANGYNSHPTVPRDTNQDSLVTSKTITENVIYTYNSLYPTDSKYVSHCQQDLSSFQQDLQGVGRYQHMFTYVSS